MSKVILVGGYGPGISNGVAEVFGAQGFTVALVGRTTARLDAGVKALEAKGVKAHAFTADLGDVAAIKQVVADVKAKLGGIDVLQWTAYQGGVAGNLLEASAADLTAIFNIPVVGLVTAIQAALPELEAKQGAVLVTNGGLGFFDASADKMGVEWGVAGLSVANSAKHKVVRLLNLQLAKKQVYVGEVMVTGVVKGSAFDQGNGTLEASAIGKRFWDLYQARKDISVTV